MVASSSQPAIIEQVRSKRSKTPQSSQHNNKTPKLKKNTAASYSSGAVHSSSAEEQTAVSSRKTLPPKSKIQVLTGKRCCLGFQLLGVAEQSHLE